VGIFGAEKERGGGKKVFLGHAVKLVVCGRLGKKKKEGGALREGVYTFIGKFRERRPLESSSVLRSSGRGGRGSQNNTRKGGKR